MATKRGSGSYDYVESQDRWRWRGYYHDPISGQRKIKYLYSTNKKKLREKVENWLLKTESGQIEVDMTLKKWVDIWLNTIIADTVKLRTKEIYTHMLCNHVVPRFGKLKLSQMTAQPYQEYLNELSEKYSSNTVATIRRYTIMCVDSAVRYGYISVNPIRNTRPPRIIKNDVLALSQKETDLIIQIAKEGMYQSHPHHDDGAEYLRMCYYTLILTAIDSGMRKGELLGLKWNDIYSDFLVVRHNLITAKNSTFLDTPKTLTSGRKILLGKRCKAALAAWRKYQEGYSQKYIGIFTNKEKLVFTNALGGYVSVTNFSRRCWRPILEKANLGQYRFHDLRHSHASQLLAAGVPPQVVAQRLGHSNMGITLKIYAHLLPSMQQSALKQIDEVFAASEENKKHE